MKFLGRPLRRRSFLGLAGFSAAVPPHGNPAGAGKEPLHCGTQKQLFIDRKFIAHARGIRLRVNPPRKAGPVLSGERPWEEQAIGGYISVLEHEGVYKMWYFSAAKGAGSNLCYATSTDGLRWDRPSLGVVEFRGSRDNNIVLAGASEGAVFLDPVAPPHQRFKTLSAAGGGRKSPLGTTDKGTLVLLASPDGIHWNQEVEVLPFHSDTQNNLFWDQRLGKYVAYLRGWNPLRCVVRCEIPREQIFQTWPYQPSDRPRYLWSIFPWGKNWPPALSTELPTVLACDEKDPPNTDVYTPNVRPYPYADSVYLGFPSIFRHTAAPGTEKIPVEGLLEVQLAVSRDGIRFDRLDRRPYIGLGFSGELDSHCIYCGLGMIRRGNQLYQYYVGYSSEHSKWPPAGSAIMLAVQRLDGFVSANAPPEGGELTTPLLTFQGSRLELNIDTSATGLAQVELQAPDGLPIPGFELRNSDPVVCNDVARPIAWRGNVDLSRLRGSPLRLRIRLHNARLFAFQFA